MAPPDLNPLTACLLLPISPFVFRVVCVRRPIIKSCRPLGLEANSPIPSWQVQVGALTGIDVPQATTTVDWRSKDQNQTSSHRSAGGMVEQQQAVQGPAGPFVCRSFPGRGVPGVRRPPIAADRVRGNLYGPAGNASKSGSSQVGH